MSGQEKGSTVWTDKEKGRGGEREKEWKRRKKDIQRLNRNKRNVSHKS